MQEFLGLLLTGRVAGTQNSGGSEPAMKINAQMLLAFPLIALIPLATIGFLSYFNANTSYTCPGCVALSRQGPGTERGMPK